MDDHGRVVVEKAIAEARIAAMGMEAENLQRLHTGLAMAYTEDDFRRLIDNMNGVFDVYRG